MNLCKNTEIIKLSCSQYVLANASCTKYHYSLGHGLCLYAVLYTHHEHVMVLIIIKTLRGPLLFLIDIINKDVLQAHF